LLTFAAAHGALDFKPGQSIGLDLPVNGKTVSLSYSIASPPGAGGSFDLCIKAGRKGSLPERLLNLQPGMQIAFSFPRGDFLLQEVDEERIFLAAGTGIAPIRSMLHWLMREHGRHRLSLLFGARDRQSLLFHSEFLALAREDPRFQYLPVLSRPQGEWSGARGHVHHHLTGILPPSGQVYVCGPLEMIRSATSTLSHIGWPSESIHYDRDCY
jgi:CDP-4-dehydro-6-deoxyglucose reductase